MSMDSDDLNDLAGEYVLGTLASAERAAFEARLRTDVAAQRAVAQWASHLQPLADGVTPAIPSPDLWQRIQRELGLTARPSMRAPAWIAAAIAAVLVGIAFLFPDFIFKPQASAVATLAPQGGEAAFVVSVAGDQKELLVRAEKVDAVPDKSYELWAVPPSGAPISLGVVEAKGETERPVPEQMRPLLVPGTTLAVSLEPEGGSPTGTPTTVMFAGALAAPSR
jgi:anti-sigma-K factor RskA